MKRNETEDKLFNFLVCYLGEIFSLPINTGFKVKEPYSHSDPSHRAFGVGAAAAAATRALL
jgi:hypothetical protein